MELIISNDGSLSARIDDSEPITFINAKGHRRKTILNYYDLKSYSSVEIASNINQLVELYRTVYYSWMARYGRMLISLFPTESDKNTSGPYYGYPTNNYKKSTKVIQRYESCEIMSEVSKLF